MRSGRDSSGKAFNLLAAELPETPFAVTEGVSQPSGPTWVPVNNLTF
jgi:hypothetical protein